MAPRIQVGFEDRELFADIVKRAGDERRSLSSMAAILVERGMKAGAINPEIAGFIAEFGEEAVIEVLAREARKRKRAA
jgi:hypothetical protein